MGKFTSFYLDPKTLKQFVLKKMRERGRAKDRERGRESKRGRAREGEQER